MWCDDQTLNLVKEDMSLTMNIQLNEVKGILAFYVFSELSMIRSSMSLLENTHELNDLILYGTLSGSFCLSLYLSVS